MTVPPLFVLGVSRSGTTMLRVILDRSPGIAIPDETFFVPQLAHRHPGVVDPTAFLDDVRRLQRLAAWEIPAEDRGPASTGMTTGEALDAVFSTYAARTASRAGATRRRCTCVTSASSSACSRMPSTCT